MNQITPLPLLAEKIMTPPDAVPALRPTKAPPKATGADVALIGIYEISKILTAPARLEVTLGNVVSVLSSFMRMRRGLVVLLDAEGLPEMIATDGWVARYHSDLASRVPQAAIDQMVATQTPLVVHDMAATPLFDGVSLGEPPEGARVAFVGVPIKAGQKVVGTLSIDRVRDGETMFRFDEDVRFLAMVANLIGQTVRLHRLVAADRERLIEDHQRIEKALAAEIPRSAAPKIAGIVGDSDALKRVMSQVAIVAKTNATVLLRGESGTGKEVFARAIHDLSPRKGKPFVKVNCAALSESVLESELFGHEKGAFTGAMNTRAGRFEMAHGGTLLLDEIGEISGDFQAKLLRVLQEGEFERVGGNRTMKVDVRLICATNKNLEEAVSKGEFRADLYYRISVVPLFLPPLRERAGDIALLARSFLDAFNRENGRRMSLSASAVDTLSRCYFPGNVRELENCVRRTATLARDEGIVASDFACKSDRCLSSTLWKGSAKPDPVAALARGEAVVATSAVSPPPAAPLSGAVAPAPPSPAWTVSSASTPAPAWVPPPAPAVSPAVAAAAAAADVDVSKLCEHADENCPALSGNRLTERDRLIEAMEKAGWVQAKAARILNLTPRQIGYALKKHNVDIMRF